MMDQTDQILARIHPQAARSCRAFAKVVSGMAKSPTYQGTMVAAVVEFLIDEAPPNARWMSWNREMLENLRDTFSEAIETMGPPGGPGTGGK